MQLIHKVYKFKNIVLYKIYINIYKLLKGKNPSENFQKVKIK